MGELSIQLPKELSNSFFFPQENIKWKDSYSHLFQPNLLFIHEAGYYASVPGISPWTEPEKYVPLLISEWNDLKQKLEPLFTIRDFSRTLPLMKLAIGIYLEFLYWTNQKPVRFPLDDIQYLTVKSVNIEDRIQFILSRPNLFHSFVQLAELMMEQEKQFSKANLIKNHTKNVRE